MDQLQEIEIEKISLNPFQPRKQFSIVELQELADSIKAVGIIHPPVVRKRDDHFELISGERRFRAAQLAGLKRIPAVVSEYSDAISAQAALIENIQRVDLNPLEVAEALQALAKQSKLNQEELSKIVGKKRSTIANYLRLLTLPDEIKQSVSENRITMGHAKAILSVADPDEQRRLHEKLLLNRYSVRETEDLAQKMGKTDSENCFIKDIQTRMQERLGTRVILNHRKDNGGTITIEYYDLDGLDRIIAKLG